MVGYTRLNKPFKEGAWWGVGGGLYGGIDGEIETETYCTEN